MTTFTRTPIRDFGLAGLIEDIRPWDVPINGFTSARNIRIEDRSISTLRDVSVLVGPFFDHLTGLIPISPVYGDPFWIADGQSVIILVFDNGEVRAYTSVGAGLVSYNQLLPLGGVDVLAEFYSTQSGEFFILTSITNIPKVVSSEDVALGFMTDMPGWPTEYRAGIIEDYKNSLVAARLIVSGTERPNLIKWSHPYSEGDTEWFWDPTDPNLLAGERPIQSSGQGIFALQPLRDSMMIYFDRSMWRMDLVGGQNIMNTRKVFSDDGAVGPLATTNVNGSAFVVGFRDIYLHDGVQKTSVSDEKITRSFYSSLDLSYPVRVAYYPERNEIWTAYRTLEEGESNKAMIFNKLYGAFTPVEYTSPITNTGDLIGLFQGPTLANDSVTWDILDGQGTTWDDLQLTAWDDFSIVSQGTRFYAIGKTPGELTEVDASVGDSRLRENALIEHSRIDLDSLLGTQGDKIIFISRMYPQFVGAGSIEMRFGTAPNTGSGVDWGSWMEFDMDEDYAIDFRQAGRYLAYQIRPKQDTVPVFAFSGFDIEWAVVGEQ